MSLLPLITPLLSKKLLKNIPSVIQLHKYLNMVNQQKQKHYSTRYSQCNAHSTCDHGSLAHSGGILSGFLANTHTDVLSSSCSRHFLKCVSSYSTGTDHEVQQATGSEEEEEDVLYKWIELRVKGHDDSVLESYATFVSMASEELGLNLDSINKPQRDIKRLTLLKSRHVYKKHRVQYEMRTYYRVIKLKHLTGTTADVFLEYIQRNLPEGVAMQVKTCALERLPSHLQEPPTSLENLEEEEARFAETGAQGSNADEAERLASLDKEEVKVDGDEEADSTSSSSESESDSSESDSDGEPKQNER